MVEPEPAPFTPMQIGDQTAPLGVGSLPPRAPGKLRYRALRLHVKGGLGEVHIAEDTELGRAVALKVIKAEYRADAISVRRFLREAEITASLEHPGIVPVHGLVHDENGQPAYAMRFVEGETLRDAIDRYHAAARGGQTAAERRLAFRRLLSHLVAACNAVAYAHSKGIIHRDLKPLNILLGQFGETLVVDWGLAKQVGRVDPAKGDLEGVATTAEETPSDATAMGQAVGTPAYMAPEQATGRWDVVGPAADVYSLGATLYQVLAGRPPFQGGNKFEVLALVQRGALQPPRQVNRDVPAALDAVCRKAMALEPGQRYATASELARDVERWLADEAVSAYRDPWPVRMARRARRHRTAVVAAVVFLVSAVVALAVGTGLIWHEQRRTAEQKQDAVREWSRAEENLNLARGLALNLLDVAEDQLPKVPKTEPVRKKMTDTTLETFRQFLRQRPDDPDLQEKTAKVHRYAANLHRLLNEVDIAEPSYRESIRLYEDLVAGSPGQQSHRDHLAQTWRDYSQLLVKVGRLGDAAEALRRSIEMAEGLRADFPERADYRRTQATALLDLCWVEYARGQFAGSAASGQQAADLFRSLFVLPPEKAHPFDPMFAASSLLGLAVSRRELGHTDAALASHAEALTQLRAQVEQVKDTVVRLNMRHFLGKALLEAGRTLTAIPDRREEAERDLDQAILIWEELQKPNPNTPLYRELQAVAYEARGQVRAALDRSGPAAADLDQSRRRLEQLAQTFPDLPSYRGHLGRTYTALGRLALARGDATGAANWLARAEESFGAALKRAPENALDRRALDELQALRK